MKVNIEIEYAGQVVTFTNLEFDDEMLVDEDYLPRRQELMDENNGRIWENFLDCVSLKDVVRL